MPMAVLPGPVHRDGCQSWVREEPEAAAGTCIGRGLCALQLWLLLPGCAPPSLPHCGGISLWYMLVLSTRGTVSITFIGTCSAGLLMSCKSISRSFHGEPNRFVQGREFGVSHLSPVFLWHPVLCKSGCQAGLTNSVLDWFAICHGIQVTFIVGGISSPEVGHSW